MKLSKTRSIRVASFAFGLCVVAVLTGAQSRLEQDSWTNAVGASETVNLTEELCLAMPLRSAWHDPTRDDSTEPGKPKEWGPIEESFRKAVKEYRFLDAANEIERLEDLLPSPMPDDYPWSWDSKFQFQAGRAELLFLGGATRASRTLCNEILQSIKDLVKQKHDNQEATTWPLNSIALVNVDCILANIAAFEGDYTASLTWYKKSLDEYWSGCGNCEESEEVWASPVIQVLEAASLPQPEAIAALNEINSGAIDIVAGNLYPTDAYAQRCHGATEATFALAQFALRRHDQAEARRLLQQVVNSNVTHCETRLIARVLLTRLSKKQVKQVNIRVGLGHQTTP